MDELTARSPLPVLLEFWAGWCGHCRAVAPELDKLAKERAGQLVIAKVDTEALPELSERFEIQSVPTLMLYRDGKQDKQAAGEMTASQLSLTFGL